MPTCLEATGLVLDWATFGSDAITMRSDRIGNHRIASHRGGQG